MGGSGGPSRRPKSIINHPLSFINSRGFTLIELLVVIAIIGLLMAILVPTLSRVRKQAKAMVCQTRLRQWGMALNMYAQDNEGRFPCNVDGSAGAWLLRGALLSVNSRDPNAPQDSFHHFRTKDMACCPMATRSRSLDPNTLPSGTSAQAATFMVGPGFVPGTVGLDTPAWVINRPSPPLVGSYGINRFLCASSGAGFDSSPAAPAKRPGVDIFLLKGKANIPVLLDSGAPSGGPGNATFGPPLDLRFFADMFVPFCVDRHDGSVNGLFLDWSVRKIGLKELWKLKWSPRFDTNGPWTLAGGVKPTRWPTWMRDFEDY